MAATPRKWYSELEIGIDCVNARVRRALSAAVPKISDSGRGAVLKREELDSGDESGEIRRRTSEPGGPPHGQTVQVVGAGLRLITATHVRVSR